MVAVENPEAVHSAWHASVQAQEAKQKPTGERPEEEDDSHPWFKSAHERRQARLAFSQAFIPRAAAEPASPMTPGPAPYHGHMR